MLPKKISLNFSFYFVCTILSIQSFGQSEYLSGEYLRIHPIIQTDTILFLKKSFINFEIEADSFTSINRANLAPPANDNCASATALVVNATCINGTTVNGTTQVGEVTTPSCVASAFTQTVWYSFVATNSNMYVNINLTSFGGSGALWSPTQWACAVYRATGCPPAVGSLISCKNSNSQGTGDGAIVNILTGLTVGQTYYIQVGYRTGMGVNQIPNYCIRVGDQFTPQCNTCSNTCGAAYGYIAPPTVAQVTSNPGYVQNPEIEGSQADTQCYTFTAINDTVDFNVIVNSTCSGGNVANFSWSLYNTSNCSTVLQTGTLANLRLTGLSIGTSYTYCYSFTVPADCYHTAYWPYFVGASPLPVEMLYFKGKSANDMVELQWATASETNSDFFRLERSIDGFNYETINVIEAAHNSSLTRYYTAKDYYTPKKVLYYRLLQFDFDGKYGIYGPIAVKEKSSAQALNFNSIQFTDQDKLSIEFVSAKAGRYNLEIYDIFGKKLNSSDLNVDEGVNSISIYPLLPTNSIYLIAVSSESERISAKIFKN